MKRQNRLRTASEFSLVYRSGRRTRLESVTAITTHQPGAEPKVGLAASRKLGGAVVRNRAKRRLRASVDPLVAFLAPGSLIVLQATPQTVGASFQKLGDDVRKALGGSRA